MKQLLSVLLALGSVTLTVDAVQACQCLPMKPRQFLKEAKTVFVGKVVEVKRSEQKFGELLVRFEVERYWKNVPGPYVTVFTSIPSGGSCGLNAVEGKRYLVFASGEDRLETGVCSARAVERASDEIKKLGKGRTVEVITITPATDQRGMDTKRASSANG